MNLYNPLYVLAIGVGAGWALVRLLRAGYDRHTVLRAVAVIGWGGLAGGYVLHFLVTILPGALPWSDHPYFGGSSIIGVISGGIIAAVVYSRVAGLSWRHLLDAVCVPAPLAQAIGRLGCLSAACCWGKPTTGWLAMRLADGDGAVALRYPTQLLAAAADLAILAGLIAVEHARRRRGRPTWPFAGFIFVVYLALYSAKRLVLEQLRATALPLVGPLTWAQLAALAGLAFAATLLVQGLRRER